MRAALRLPRAATYAEYLAVEQHSEHRHELIDGVIVAMAGSSDEHNAISGRLAMQLGMRLQSLGRERIAPHGSPRIHLPLLRAMSHPHLHAHRSS